MRKGFPIIVSAASGTGKTTLVDRLLQADPSIKLSISYTTRVPRDGELDGVDYYFVDIPTFRKMIAHGDFVEWAEVHGNFYGSSKSATEALLASGNDVVFIVDVQGGDNLKKIFPTALMLFLVLPSMDELEARLRQRGTDDNETITRRLLGAYQEIKVGLYSYEYIVINTLLDQALFDVSNIIHAQRIRMRDRTDLLAEIHKSI